MASSSARGDSPMEARSSSPAPLATPASPTSSRIVGAQHGGGSDSDGPRHLPRGDIGGSQHYMFATSPGRSLPATPSSTGGLGGRASSRRSDSRRSSPRRRGDSPNPRTPMSDVVGSSDPSNDPSTGDDRAVIWGTTVNMDEVMLMFTDFLRNYRLPRPGAAGGAGGSSSDIDEDDEPHYQRMLAEIADTQVYNLNVDLQCLYEHPASQPLYDLLVKYPQEVIPLMDLAVHREFERMFPQAANQMDRRIQVRTFNMRSVTRMRDLNPADISQLVSIRGMVTRTSGIIPDLKVAFFRCLTCGNTEEVIADRGRIDEPAVCSRCDSRHSFELVHNRCVFSDRQHIKLQETPESIPEGETPNTVTLFAFDALVDVARPGDRVEITGIYRATTDRTNPRTRTVRSVYSTYLDVLHVKKTDKARLSAEDPTAPPDSEMAAPFAESSGVVRSEELKSRMEAIASDPDVYDKMARSLAPSIWEMDDVKKGLLCMLFGGTHKELGKQGKMRGEINVLLCGDPGTSKSQLLTYVNKIAPRGVYTSGKGSSAVGLTAYVVRDPETRELVLESGALVLSDRGICCIDEFDKMDDITRSILHEAMEQQTVSIAKAGIVASLNARTSVLASANPVESRWNAQRSVVDNLQLPPTLLSRFDLIYLVLDKVDKTSDARLARHLVALYHPEPTLEKAPYSMAELSEYLTYAKTNIQPVISDEAASMLVTAYVSMRGAGRKGGRNTITATPRQLESLIRLAEALARIRLSETVDPDDVTEAQRLMSAATQTAATDPITGAIDMGRINTGRTASDIDDVERLADAMRPLLSGRRRGHRVMLGALTKELERQSDIPVDKNAVQDALRILASDGLIKYAEGGRQITVLNV